MDGKHADIWATRCPKRQGQTEELSFSWRCLGVELVAAGLGSYFCGGSKVGCNCRHGDAEWHGVCDTFSREATGLGLFETGCAMMMNLSDEIFAGMDLIFHSGGMIHHSEFFKTRQEPRPWLSRCAGVLFQDLL